MKTIVDPPSGWKYGFPKELDLVYVSLDPESRVIELENWFLANNYPKSLIDQGMLKHCRYWSK